MNLPYQVQVNGYQTVCDGCFAPVPIQSAHRSALRSGDAIHHRREQPLQRIAVDVRETSRTRPAGERELHLEPLPGHRLERRVPFVFLRRHSVTAAGRPRAASTETAITTSGTTSTRRTSTNCRSARKRAWLAHIVNGWQISGTAFWHSGVPFTVLSAPYTANGNGILQGSGPQFASVVSGVPLYTRQAVANVTQPGTLQWLNPDAFRSTVDPSTGACAGGDSPANCQFGNLGRNTLRGPWFTWSDLYLTKRFTLTERAVAADRRTIFQRVQSSELRAAIGGGRNPGEHRNANRIWRHQPHHVATHRASGRRPRGDNSPRMIALRVRVEF